MKHYFNRLNLSWLALSLFVYLVIAVLISTNIINAYYQITLASICINIILAVSLNLIIGINGQFSLGHAGFMAIGAYSAAIITSLQPNLGGMLVAIIVGAIIASLAALVVAIPTLRLRGDYLAIATLGFGEIIRIIILNMKITSGASGISNIPLLTTWPILWLSVVLCILVIVNFGRSTHGRACISIREDEIAAESMGIPTTRYKVMAFVIGAIFASLAGVLYANFYYVVKPEMFGFSKSIDILVIVVFGGLGSVSGSIIAGIVLGIISMFLQQFGELRMIIYALALICIMIFRPQGLLGTKEFTFSAMYRRLASKGGGVSHGNVKN
ncbi:MAG: branched-chain amino acid ABC transporter permease [Erysipelotrichaceae bacterium]